ncbi:MAG: M20/M25/M40 family metallo-hydrolase [Nocardiopsaceae bacterium]|nr:M20/M25/M40 family metallo-hydrolase [Nocardiopsaceae bacterium]
MPTNAPQVRARPTVDPSLVARFDASLPSILADIEELVACESPSGDLAAVARSAGVLATVGERQLGAAPERIVIEGRTHLRWRLGDVPGRVLVLGHHDTVWPIGSLRSHPFSVRDGVLRGPGSFDMKAGLVMALHALAALGDATGVSLLVTGDEEVGSPSSRRLIEEESRGRAAAFILEAAGEGGALKLARKGVSHYAVKVTGRAAHAGLEHGSTLKASLQFHGARLFFAYSFGYTNDIRPINTVCLVFAVIILRKYSLGD